MCVFFGKQVNDTGSGDNYGLAPNLMTTVSRNAALPMYSYRLALFPYRQDSDEMQERGFRERERASEREIERENCLCGSS